MAPEQLEGKEADVRTDIFAFGAVLYEMASGKKAFSGKSRASLMAAILEREPERLSQIAPLIPPALDRLVAGCLAKDPEERWQTAHDLKLQLRWILESGSEMGLRKPVTARPSRRELIAWTLVGLLTVWGVYTLWQIWKGGFDKTIARFEIATPGGEKIDTVALSPNGRKLAFVSRDSGDKRRLWIRSVDSFAAQLIPEADGASFPFWSPDGRVLAFFADGSLRKLDLNSGSIASLCKAPDGRGGSWGSKNIIVFAPNSFGPLHKIDAAGGESTPVTEIRETIWAGHRSPWFLPDGDHFLYWSQTGAGETSSAIFLSSVRSPKEQRLLLHSTEGGIYSANHLLYANSEALMAVRFDPTSQELTGAPFLVAESVAFPGIVGFRTFSGAENGTLAYVPASANRSELVWYSTDGMRLDTLGPPAFYIDFQISPDGISVAVTVGESSGNLDIWIYETDRKSPTRVTTHARDELNPVWSRDGRSIVFTSTRNNTRDLYLKEIETIQPEKLLFESAEAKYPASWSPDGKTLLFDWGKSRDDLWLLNMDTAGPKAEPFLNSEHDETGGRFSPDGKWIAYVSSEQGSKEVFVISYPGKLGKKRISTAGGRNPRWSADGTKIYYLDSDNYIVETRFRTELERLIPDVPKRLFAIRSAGLFEPFDVAPDGQRFLVNERPNITNSAPVKIVLNWPLEFQKTAFR